MSASSFKELRAHIGHELECVIYGYENVAVECMTCNEVLFDFNNDDTEVQKIFISKTLADELQDYLNRDDIDFHNEKIARDSTIATFTARFSNGFEADIKVCAGSSNCFIDPVLFNEQGCEVSVLDCEANLLGEYYFEFEGNDYVVEIIACDDSLVKEG